MDLPHFSWVSSWARNYRSHGSRTSQGTIKLRGRAERPSCSSDTKQSWHCQAAAVSAAGPARFTRGWHWASSAQGSFACLLCHGLSLEKMSNPSWLHPGPTPDPPAAQPLPTSGRAPQACLPVPGSSPTRLPGPHATLQTSPPLPPRPASVPMQSSSPFSIPLTAAPTRPPCPPSITAVTIGTNSLTAGKNRHSVKWGQEGGGRLVAGPAQSLGSPHPRLPQAGPQVCRQAWAWRTLTAMQMFPTLSYTNYSCSWQCKGLCQTGNTNSLRQVHLNQLDHLTGSLLE